VSWNLTVIIAETTGTTITAILYSRDLQINVEWVEHLRIRRTITYINSVYSLRIEQACQNEERKFNCSRGPKEAGTSQYFYWRWLSLFNNPNLFDSLGFCAFLKKFLSPKISRQLSKISNLDLNIISSRNKCTSILGYDYWYVITWSNFAFFCFV